MNITTFKTSIQFFNSDSVPFDQVKVVSEPERIDVFLTRSCVKLTIITKIGGYVCLH